jgi:hypothetical protein
MAADKSNEKLVKYHRDILIGYLKAEAPRLYQNLTLAIVKKKRPI